MIMIGIDRKACRARFGLIALFPLLVAPCAARSQTPLEDFPRFAPASPEKADATFRTRPGFQMRLIAAEPLVIDPVAAAYDEDGRLYVVEMSDYPYVDKANDKPFVDNVDDPPLGRLRVLLDRDDDGRFDEAHIVADKLSWPTGLAIWKGGVFVGATPDIWYFKDTDGDFKADVREKLFTGFRKYNIQAVMNNLAWGLDHLLYGAASGNGGQVHAADAPDSKSIRVLRQDFRFDPESRRFETISGGARFGNTFDDWGNRFLCDIRNPAEHVVLPARYLARNPALLAPRVLHDAAEAGDQIPVYRISPPEPWRELRARRWTEIGKVIPRSELVAAGVLTSSSGVTCYRGDAYPAEFRGNLFLGEVANNAIHRMVVRPDGVTFRATRAADETKRECVASLDTWFRPVNFVNAPDGTLHVLDMYREFIEHPWSIPDDIKAKLDLRSGEDRGRIYRLEPEGFRHRATPRLSRLATAELVALLAHPNAWHSETAHRLIHERQDADSIPALRKLLRSSKSARGRLKALWSLEGLHALNDEDRLIALRDAAPELREHAIRLSEPRLEASESLLGRVLELADDPAPRVRFQTAFSLGAVRGSQATAALARIARRDLADPWIRTAVLSSVSGRAADLFRTLFDDRELTTNPEGFAFLASLSRAALKEPSGVESVLTTLRRLDPASLPFGVDGRSEAFLESLGSDLLAHRVGLLDPNALGPAFSTRLNAHVHDMIAADQAEPALRSAALRLARFLPFADAKALIEPLLDVRQPALVRDAAVAVLLQIPEPPVASILLEHWSQLAPVQRAVVLRSITSRPPWIDAFLTALEGGSITPAEVPKPTRERLLADKDATMHKRAAAVFAATEPQSRRDVMTRYLAGLMLPADTAQGRAVFERECMTCHKMGSKGNAVGPNLVTVQHRTPDELLLHILDPNREVAPDFVEYLVTLKDGRVLNGIIESESATSVTLKHAEAAVDTVLRTDIEEVKSTGRSLMPEELEHKITPQEMTNLIGFLRTLQTL